MEANKQPEQSRVPALDLCRVAYELGDSQTNTHSNLRPLAVDEITDLRKLRRLAREERLYLDTTPSTSSVDMEAVERALTYISQIDSHAHPHAMPSISILWRRILTHPMLCDKLTIQKGRQEGELNRYRLMYLVTYLLEADIYVGVSALQLHHMLEHTNKKDAIYRGQMMYALEMDQQRVLRDIISDFRKNFMV